MTMAAQTAAILLGLAVILNEVARHVAGATTFENTVGICAMHTVYDLTGANVTAARLYFGAN